MAASFDSSARAVTRPGLFPGLLLCLLVSGASGLIYEVAWVRSLELIFGATSLAVATVLAAFMGGLALGSRLTGEATGRLERFHPLRVYAVIECLIAAAGVFVPLALTALVPVYQSIWSHFHASFPILSLWRFVLCGTVLVVPTALMGATLPITSRLTARDDGRPGAGARGAAVAGRSVGLLYAANTLGAVAGCAAAGLAFLPSIGLRSTEYLAVGLNLLAAATALLLSWKAPAPRRVAESADDRCVPREDLQPGPGGALLLVLYAVSGGVSMVYEVAWSRLLVLVLGSSTYSYTIMLTTFLAGMALGAWLGARHLRHGSDPLLLAALCQVLVALSTYAGLFLFRDLPFLYVVAHERLQPSPRGLLLVQLGLAALLMILPTVGLGAMFPVTLGGLRPEGSATPRVVGRVYSWNTVGAILGSIAAGFYLVPRWGSRNTLLFGVATSALLGLLALLQARVTLVPRLRALFATTLVAFLANLAVASPVLQPDVLSSGVFRYADRYRGSDRASFLRRARESHGEILMFREGLTCTVTVFRTTAARALLVNGKPDASVPPGLADPFGRSAAARMGDLPTQVLVAQLPLLLSRRADRVLVVGLGSGVTLGSVLTHPVGRVECVELEDAVVQAARLFDDVSGAPLEDPRVRLVVNDARNHLLVTRDPYDVIISEPSNPWVAGAASLFTREFFQIASTRLAPDGVFCQWLQLYETTADDFRAILRSFASVFPDVHVFRVATDAILVGSRGGAVPGLDGLRDRLGSGAAAADLERIGVRAPEDLLAHYWIGGAELRSFLDPGPLNTDDNMLIEFKAPLRMLARLPAKEEAQARELVEMFAGRTTGVLSHLDAPTRDGHALALSRARLAEATLRAGYPDLAVLYARDSLRAERNPWAARIHGDCLARGGAPAAARSWLLTATREFPRDAGVLRSLVEVERASGDWPAVRRDAIRLAALAPGDRRALYVEGESLYRLGENAAAYTILAALRAGGPGGGAPRSALATGTTALAPAAPSAQDLPDLGLYLGALDSARGRPEAAIAPLREHLARHPSDREARTLLAAALERTGRGREALAERRRLSPDAPEQAATRLREAESTWLSAPIAKTRATLEEGREFDPDSDAIDFLLARVRVRQGDSPGAIALLEEILEARPDRPWAVGYLAQLDAARGNVSRARLLAQRYVALTGRTWETIADE